MSLSSAWIFLVVITAAIVAFVVIFANSANTKNVRSRERAEREAREAGRAIAPADAPRPQDSTRVPGRSFGP